MGGTLQHEALVVLWKICSEFWGFEKGIHLNAAGRSTGRMDRRLQMGRVGWEDIPNLLL